MRVRVCALHGVVRGCSSVCACAQVALVRADRGAGAFPGQLVVLSEKPRGEMEEELGVSRMREQDSRASPWCMAVAEAGDFQEMIALGVSDGVSCFADVSPCPRSLGRRRWGPRGLRRWSLARAARSRQTLGGCD